MGKLEQELYSDVFCGRYDIYVGVDRLFGWVMAEGEYKGRLVCGEGDSSIVGKRVGLNEYFRLKGLGEIE